MILGVTSSTYPQVRLKLLGSLRGGAGFPHTEQGNVHALLPFYKVKDLVQSDGRGYLGRTDNYVDERTAQRLGAFVFSRNSILIAKVGAALLLHRFARAAMPCCIDNNMMGIIPDPHRLEPDFLHYAMANVRFNDVVNPGAVPSLNIDAVGNKVIPLPPLLIQKAIADFLDRKTAAIDALIEKKQRLLALLAEKRSALINHAVTKGLDPQVPMKDSGIPWIGEIPAHWEVKRLKFLVTHIIDCHHSTPVYDEDAPYPALRTADISPGFLDVENARRVNATEFLHRIGRLRPRTHDIIYSREGERYGIAALVPDGAEVCLAQRVMLLRCAAVHDAGYVMWTLNADCTYQQMKQYVVGATSPHVNIGDIREAWLSVPPAVEQRQINGVITQALVFQRKLSERIERHIARLQEYRQALITAAVTGQLDIPQPEARG